MVNGQGTDTRDIKILILAIMSGFPHGVEYGKAVEILSHSIGINGMDAVEYVSELEGAELLMTFPESDETYLCVTAQGSAAADSALQSVRFVDVDEVLDRALYEYDLIVNDIRYSAELNPSDEDGCCTVDYLCTERGKMRCRVSVFYDSFALADAALRRLRSNPEYFRRYITMYLNRE